jgi:hypothetical protein
LEDACCVDNVDTEHSWVDINDGRELEGSAWRAQEWVVE